jgi:hypothetical protein
MNSILLPGTKNEKNEQKIGEAFITWNNSSLQLL